MKVFFKERKPAYFFLPAFFSISCSCSIANHIPTYYSHIDEASLVEELRGRNPAALGYLYDQYSGALYGVIFRILQHEAISEEVLQDTFLKIWNRIDQFDPEKGKLFTWMYRLARNNAIDRTRSGDFVKSTKTGTIGNLVNMESDWRTQKQTDAIGVSELIKTLPEEQRFVVEHVYFKGYTQSEIADEYQLPLGTVKTRLRLALIHLRNRMDKL